MAPFSSFTPSSSFALSPSDPTAGAVHAARIALDEESTALARVLESVRDQHILAIRLGGAPSQGGYWSGDAERRFRASAADLVDTLARARDALEAAVECAARAAITLGLAETRAGATHER